VQHATGILSEGNACRTIVQSAEDDIVDFNVEGEVGMIEKASDSSESE
jgi:hypothetical protein